jgi:crossover junction endodeoxyribonuclease RuvC
MRILGVDPGLDITGYGVIEERVTLPSVIEAGVIRTSYKDPLIKRLNIIYSEITNLIEECKPDICVVEQLYSHYKHPMTAILMGHARGVVLFSCSCKGIGVVGYPAKTVKNSVTGNGNASKQQVQRVVSNFLKLKNIKRPADVTDALALCLTHIRHSNSRKRFNL